MNRVTARANANIALVKYWGKSQEQLNIPAVPSLSMTLDGIGTVVTVSLSPNGSHMLFIEGNPSRDDASLRLANYLEQLRTMYPFSGFLSVKSKATVPYKAGLASSASFYAALAKALNCFLNLKMSDQELSIIARMGSASAARSIFGGFSCLRGGIIPHEDAYASSLSTSLELAMVISVLDDSRKAIGSREAMIQTAKSSPFYKAFVETAVFDFEEAKTALALNAFEKLGAVMEYSTLKMHASMWAAEPSINYIRPNTLKLMEHIYALRKEHGPIAFFTMDAGPNVKILCEARNADFIAESLKNIGSSLMIRVSLPGESAKLCDEHVL